MNEKLKKEYESANKIPKQKEYKRVMETGPYIGLTEKLTGSKPKKYKPIKSKTKDYSQMLKEGIVLRFALSKKRKNKDIKKDIKWLTYQLTKKLETKINVIERSYNIDMVLNEKQNRQTFIFQILRKKKVVGSTVYVGGHFCVPCVFTNREGVFNETEHGKILKEIRSEFIRMRGFDK